jgi:hypothetical protein
MTKTVTAKAVLRKRNININFLLHEFDILSITDFYELTFIFDTQLQFVPKILRTYFMPKSDKVKIHFLMIVLFDKYIYSIIRVT